jgi:Family of unknown function (DUF6496)
MSAQSRGQKKTVSRVMHEFKHGELGSGGGRKVKNPKQAIAIALSEAGASRKESPARAARNRARTKANERSGDTGDNSGARRKSARTRQELYEAARKRGVPGRSRMTKAELERALKAGMR